MIDPITGLPSSNTQQVYAGDKPIAPQTPQIVVPTTIDATSMSPTPKVNIPSPTGVPSSTYTAPITETANYTNALTEAQKAEKDYQAKLDQAKASSGDIANLQAQIGGKAADTANAYEKGGVNSAYNQLQDYQAQMQAITNESSLIPLSVQKAFSGREGVKGAVEQGLQAGLLRDNAIRALTIGQGAALAEANYNKAKNLADQQVNIKYAQMEADIKSKEAQLASLDKYTLAPAEAKQKTLLERQYAKEKQDIEDKKANEKAINDMIVGAAPYAPASTIAKVNQMKAQGKSRVEIAAALGKYGGDYLGDLVKLSTINKNNAEYNKTVKEIQALGQPLVNNAPLGSNAYSANSWVNSAVNKESLGDSQQASISKNLTVLDQLSALQSNISKQNSTGFIKGKVNNLMASIGQNADVGTINAQLQAIVPNLARGVYGEVGVLTDNDIANYRKTLPTLTMPEEQNKAVMALTLRAVQKSLKNTLDTAANSKKDVSRFVGDYQRVTNEINRLNDESGVNKTAVIDYVAKNRSSNPNLGPMVRDLKAQGVKDSEILQVLGVEN